MSKTLLWKSTFLDYTKKIVELIPQKSGILKTNILISKTLHILIEDDSISSLTY